MCCDVLCPGETVVTGVAGVDDGGHTCCPQPPLGPVLDCFNYCLDFSFQSLISHFISLGLGSQCPHLKSVAGDIILLYFTDV